MGGRGANPNNRGSETTLSTRDDVLDILMDMNDEDFMNQSRARGAMYFGSDFGRDLNRFLDSHPGATAEQISTEFERPDFGGEVKKLDHAMAPISKSLTTERYVDEFSLPQLNTKNPQSLVGKTIHTNGYLSTTYDAKNSSFEFENYPAKIIITAPKGTKAVLGANDKEAEVLFHRGSSYKILSYTMGKNTIGDPQIIYKAVLVEGRKS